MAVGKAKAEVFDDEVASVPVLSRAAKNLNSLAGMVVPPAIPEPGPQQPAYPSINLDHSQSIGGYGTSPRYARSLDMEPSVHFGSAMAGPSGSAGQHHDYSDRSRENPQTQNELLSKRRILDALAAAAASHVYQEKQEQALAAATAAASAVSEARQAAASDLNFLSGVDSVFLKSLLQRAINELSDLVNNPHQAPIHHPSMHHHHHGGPAAAHSLAPPAQDQMTASMFGGSVPHTNGGFSKWNPGPNVGTYTSSPLHYQAPNSGWGS